MNHNYILISKSLFNRNNENERKYKRYEHMKKDATET